MAKKAKKVVNKYQQYKHCKFIFNICGDVRSILEIKYSRKELKKVLGKCAKIIFRIREEVPFKRIRKISISRETAQIINMMTSLQSSLNELSKKERRKELAAIRERCQNLRISFGQIINDLLEDQSLNERINIENLKNEENSIIVDHNKYDDEGKKRSKKDIKKFRKISETDLNNDLKFLKEDLEEEEQLRRNKIIDESKPEEIKEEESIFVPKKVKQVLFLLHNKMIEYEEKYKEKLPVTVKKYKILRLPILCYTQPTYINKESISGLSFKLFELYPGIIMENQYVVAIKSEDYNSSKIFHLRSRLLAKLNKKTNKKFIDIMNDTAIYSKYTPSVVYLWFMKEKDFLILKNPRIIKAVIPFPEQDQSKKNKLFEQVQELNKRTDKSTKRLQNIRYGLRQKINKYENLTRQYIGEQNECDDRIKLLEEHVTKNPNTKSFIDDDIRMLRKRIKKLDRKIKDSRESVMIFIKAVKDINKSVDERKEMIKKKMRKEYGIKDTVIT